MLKLITLLFVLSSCSSNHLEKVGILEGKKKSQYEDFGKEYMVSTQGVATTEAAKFVFKNGGNIFDAAVAASFAISVERPHSTGIGGGGFMLIYDAKKNETIAFDFREMAPRMAYKKMFLDQNGKQLKDKSLTGPLAAGTPGLVAGILEVHKEYGSLDLKTIMKPAIELAENGMIIYPALEKAIKSEAKRLCKFPSSKKIFLDKNCQALKAGTILYQKDLAGTLKRIAKLGKDGFYKGQTASGILQTMKKYKGLISAKDLEEYKVKKRIPVEGTYKGYKIVSMPPPSSGGTHIIQILNILEGYDLKSLGSASSESIHLTSSAMQIAFADRAKYMGDSDFKNVPVSQLIDKAYASRLRKMISKNRALKSKDFPVNFNTMKKEPDHTTHFTLMDKSGNVVTSTQTINGWFGSALVAKGTGVILNNEMDDFASHVGGINLFGAVGGKNNLVEPRKRPLSSMSPTIIFKDDKPLMSLGTPSGTRILTCVMQTILNYLEYDMPLWDAVASTRYHHQWNPEYIRVGEPGFSKKTTQELQAMGHKIKKKNLGCKIQAIESKNGILHGVSDPREEGMSFGI